MRIRQAVQSLTLGHSRTEGRTDRQAGLDSTQSVPSNYREKVAGWTAHCLSVCLSVCLHNAQTGSTVHPPSLQWYRVLSRG